jgi:UDP-glucose 4-epimerase
MPKVLLTGATGYIGSHTWIALEEAGFEVVGIDDFSNSSPRVLERLAKLLTRPPQFERADVCDRQAVAGLITRHGVDATVHFAALKAVGESVVRPLEYYRVNVGGLISVCEAMLAAGVTRFVLSGSATVYGDPQTLPIREDAPLHATNPYGQTKLFSEQILADVRVANPSWQNAVLRYFNPVGAHESGLIGEDPRGPPNNLMPYVAQVAIGRRPRLRVFGSDYPTPDGTGVRDYIHVQDLAAGHVAALRRLMNSPDSFTVNLGTGSGHSVLEVIRAYEAACGRAIPYDIVPRRPGDVAACYADPSASRELLGWSASRDLSQMCVDSWLWQSMNPEGFGRPVAAASTL